MLKAIPTLSARIITSVARRGYLETIRPTSILLNPIQVNESRIRTIHFSNADKDLIFGHMLFLKADNIQNKIQFLCVHWFSEPGQLRQFYVNAAQAAQRVLDDNLLQYFKYLCGDLEKTITIDELDAERQSDWLWVLRHQQVGALIDQMARAIPLL